MRHRVAIQQSKVRLQMMTSELEYTRNDDALLSLVDIPCLQFQSSRPTFRPC